MEKRFSQIRQVHATFIHAVVKACHHPDDRRQLDPVLAAARENGWTELTKAVESLLAGTRNETVLAGLDTEDRVIITAILEGLKNPESLPDPAQKTDPADAAPSLASIIRAARSDPKALNELARMAEQMSAVGGEMAELASLMRRLVDGERDLDQLTAHTSMKTKKLLQAVIDELSLLERH